MGARCRSAVSGLDRSSLTRLLLTAALPVAFMIMSASARAQQGANGINGADCFTDGCMGGNGTDGESVTANGDSVTATGGDGGSGGRSFGVPFSFGGKLMDMRDVAKFLQLPANPKRPVAVAARIADENIRHAPPRTLKIAHHRSENC